MHPQTLVALIVMSLVFVSGWVLYVREDLKIRIWRDPKAATSGVFTSTREAVVYADMNRALRTAKDAMRQIGSGDPRIDKLGNQVIGWVGTSLSRRSEPTISSSSRSGAARTGN